MDGVRRFLTGAFSIALGLMVGATGAAQPTGILTGRVFVDTLYQPLPDAEVVLPELNLRALTGRRGEFRIEAIPGGSHRLVIRKIGYGMHEAVLLVTPGAVVERVVVLPRLTRLDAVVVVGESSLPVSFLEHRWKGFGHFMTRNELERQGNRRLSDILSTVAGLGVVFGRTGQGWVLSRRYSMPIRSIQAIPCTGMKCSNTGEDVYVPTTSEARTGLRVGCYARVYLDRMLLNASTPAEPVNVNEFFSQQLEAIEYFSGPAQTPIEYARLNSNCGVLVLHTRRSP